MPSPAFMKKGWRLRQVSWKDSDGVEAGVQGIAMEPLCGRAAEAPKNRCLNARKIIAPSLTFMGR